MQNIMKTRKGVLKEKLNQSEIKNDFLMKAEVLNQKFSLKIEVGGVLAKEDITKILDRFYILE